jgi:ribosomal biogenesis protein LAS1
MCFLTAFNVIRHEQVSTLEHETFEEVNHSERFEPQTEELEDESILEIPRSSPKYEISDVTKLSCPLKSRLLVCV